MMNKVLCALVLTLTFHTQISCQKKEVKSRVSAIENRVIDEADLLTQKQEETIYSLIAELEKNIGSQLAIVTIGSLKGIDIDQYSIKTSETLMLGREQEKDGVLIVVVYNDRQTRIEVGYGLEKILKDDIAGRIIREILVPKFREQKVYEGLYTAVDSIKSLIEQNKELVGQAP